MNLTNAIIVALLFATWPLLLGKHELPKPYPMIIVMVITLAPYFFQEFTPINEFKVPIATVILISIMAGMCNSVGLVMYSQFFGKDNAKILIVTTTSLIPVFAMIVGSIMEKQFPTMRECVGVTLVMIGIWIMASEQQ